MIFGVRSTLRRNDVFGLLTNESVNDKPKLQVQYIMVESKGPETKSIIILFESKGQHYW